MAATRDLTSGENCFNKSSWGNISYYDGFESHTSTNPLLRKGRVGSSPTCATNIFCWENVQQINSNRLLIYNGLFSDTKQIKNNKYRYSNEYPFKENI